MKVSDWLVLLALYVAYFFGHISGVVGIQQPAYVLSWEVPYLILFMLLIPAFFGYMAGREDNS